MENMVWYARIVVFVPAALAVSFLASVAIGKWLKHVSARYPEARR